ncbi:MAG TPA: TetR family transcriptional regulator [Acetivibrio sp.]|nr:TetR family transcriptional regulator [Clostridium sp.]HOQ36653.1 TetR family transcriptional regulator [Acetivibrio sp.]HPT91796.1 TetR family transcriptional regulator [Acetivibrio sp.]HQA57297.1 TetR family transcriptional regulator [Acetivibrio sp.]
MSKDFLLVVITKMHIRLNELIEKNDFDLLCEEVQLYSRRLDKFLSYYYKAVERNPELEYNLKLLDNAVKCSV